MRCFAQADGSFSAVTLVSLRGRHIIQGLTLSVKLSFCVCTHTYRCIFFLQLFLLVKKKKNLYFVDFQGMDL